MIGGPTTKNRDFQGVVSFILRKSRQMCVVYIMIAKYLLTVCCQNMSEFVMGLENGQKLLDPKQGKHPTMTTAMSEELQERKKCPCQ